MVDARSVDQSNIFGSPLRFALARPHPPRSMSANSSNTFEVSCPDQEILEENPPTMARGATKSWVIIEKLSAQVG